MHRRAKGLLVSSLLVVAGGAMAQPAPAMSAVGATTPITTISVAFVRDGKTVNQTALSVPDDQPSEYVSTDAVDGGHGTFRVRVAMRQICKDPKQVHVELSTEAVAPQAPGDASSNAWSGCMELPVDQTRTIRLGRLWKVQFLKGVERS
ncbi:hypothetical protein ACN9MB_20250 [Dyella kyungheensis]|uniref:hypothetical protein n=1 Tax=Dyella kyungheensis TaxID=1242174 RepID=UPI003CF4C30A